MLYSNCCVLTLATQGFPDAAHRENVLAAASPPTKFTTVKPFTVFAWRKNESYF